MKLDIKRDPLAALAVLLATFTSACASISHDAGDRQFAACEAYAPAYKVTDDFMASFNTKDAQKFGAVFHFPSVRIASGKVVQCGPTKAHMLTTFVRYDVNNKELSRFNSLYIVEFKNNRWGLTARSSFAP